MKDDPFYSASNMEHLKAGMAALDTGKGVEHELIEDDGQEYECGQVVRFKRGDKELTGEVVVVDDRRRERDIYGCDWSYDILVDDYQDASCVFKHVPECEVLGAK